MSGDRLLGLIQCLPDGLSEIYLHPSTVGGYAGSATGYRYEDELAALLDSDVIAAAARIPRPTTQQFRRVFPDETKMLAIAENALRNGGVVVCVRAICDHRPMKLGVHHRHPRGAGDRRHRDRLDRVWRRLRRLFHHRLARTGVSVDLFGHTCLCPAPGDGVVCGGRQAAGGVSGASFVWARLDPGRGLRSAAVFACRRIRHRREGGGPAGRLRPTAAYSTTIVDVTTEIIAQLGFTGLGLGLLMLKLGGRGRVARQSDRCYQPSGLGLSAGGVGGFGRRCSGAAASTCRATRRAVRSRSRGDGPAEVARAL